MLNSRDNLLYMTNVKLQFFFNFLVDLLFQIFNKQQTSAPFSICDTQPPKTPQHGHKNIRNLLLHAAKNGEKNLTPPEQESDLQSGGRLTRDLLNYLPL